MTRRKKLSIEELKRKQKEIAAQLQQAEREEQATIGCEMQRITGIMTWEEIIKSFQITPITPRTELAAEAVDEASSVSQPPQPPFNPYN